MSELLEDIRKYWTKRAKGYSEYNQGELSGEQREKWRQAILAELPDKPLTEIHLLDVGTGPGFFAIILAEAGIQVTAVDYTEEMLKVLEQEQVPATFFLLGENAEQYGEQVRMIAEQGHLIGNHTWRHVQVTSLPKEEAEEEILAVSSLVEELTGNGTSYVRPPFGIWDPELEEELDMIPVLWTIDTLDWTTQNVDWIVEKTVQDAGENDIILMHDSYESTVQAAERIIRRLKAEGFEFVTVDQVIMD